VSEEILKPGANHKLMISFGYEYDQYKGIYKKGESEYTREFISDLSSDRIFKLKQEGLL